MTPFARSLARLLACLQAEAEENFVKLDSFNAGAISYRQLLSCAHAHAPASASPASEPWPGATAPAVAPRPRATLPASGFRRHVLTSDLS